MTTNKTTIKNRSIGLYIHLPFCQRKCSYCGFLSLVDQPAETIAAYLEALLAESGIRSAEIAKMFNLAHGVKPSVDTLYIGGGTPSLLSGEQAITLLEGLRQHWDVSQQAEITMESNPNSLTREKLHAYKKAGVNRLSIGIQSFDDNILKSIGRLHDKSTAMEAVSMAKDAGLENVSVDLIFGLPGQSLAQWTDTLQTAVSLNPEHLSVYTLQMEEGTPLYEAYKEEKLPLLDLEVDRACYRHAVKFLDRHGYHQYEISNFSLDGYECAHNLKYWSMDEFLGLGLIASSYMDGVRWQNLADMDEWHAAISEGVSPTDRTTVKKDNKQDEMGIFLFTGLRKTVGISLSEFRQRFGLSVFEAYGHCLKQLKTYKEQGLLDWSDAENGRLWITRKGIDCSNDIMSEFV
jgi:oxygen-independent coproporphyrinogen-3 oxidase